MSDADEDLELEEDFDAEDLDEEDLDLDDDLAEDDLDGEELVGDDLVGDDLDEETEETTRARRADDAGEEEEDLETVDDVEADLDTILKDRLATYDEDEEDEEEEPAPTNDDGDIPQRREFEFACPSCFLLVNAKEVRRTGECPQCGVPIDVPKGVA